MQSNCSDQLCEVVKVKKTIQIATNLVAHGNFFILLKLLFHFSISYAPLNISKQQSEKCLCNQFNEN